MVTLRFFRTQAFCLRGERWGRKPTEVSTWTHSIIQPPAGSSRMYPAPYSLPPQQKKYGLLLQGNVLMAQPFGAETLQLAGEAVPVPPRKRLFARRANCSI